MGRRVSLSSLSTERVENVPGHSTPILEQIRPSHIAATPLNPRRNFGTTEQLTALGESLRVRQLQPVVVVPRKTYLKLWPEHEDVLGTARYVLANGERRWRAASTVALDSLDAMVREEIADSRADFLDALLSENLDRENFDLIEEAHAVEAMVAECGTAKVAAERFRRHESWVSQRRALLKLTPDLQEQVRVGELPLRIARSIASSPPAEQAAAWRRMQDEQEKQAQERAAKKKQSSGPAPGEPETKSGTAPRGNESTGKKFTAVKKTASDTTPSSQGIPWQSPEAMATLIREHFTPDEVARLVALLSTAPETQRRPA